MIVTYLRDVLGVTPSNLASVPYDSLIFAYLIVLSFIGAYRTSELVYEDCSRTLVNDDGSVQTWPKIKGLRWRDVRIEPDAHFRGGRKMQVSVSFWKTQQNEEEAQVKLFATPCCNQRCNCVCDFFDCFSMHQEVLRRRRCGSHEFMPDSLHTQNLGTNPDDFIFVTSRGILIRYGQLLTKMNQMTKALKIKIEKKLTCHSLRVGATSTAYMQGVPCLQMCRFVEWSVKALNVAHALYVKIERNVLANIPFDILHGVAQPDGNRYSYIELMPETWKIRKDIILSELYLPTVGGKKPNELSAKRKRRLKRKRIPAIPRLAFAAAAS